MTPPNFFILGAPRSATTYLYRALAEHPQIYMSTVKEPGFFSEDGREPRYIPASPAQKNKRTWDQYLELFSDGSNLPIRGEASTIYLADSYAAARINERLDSPPHLIAILRNPAERAYSHYVYHRMLGVEPAATFEAALAEEEQGGRADWNMQWRYRETGLYGKHVQRYRHMFGPKRLLILRHEEFQEPDQVFERVFRFLGVSPIPTVRTTGKVNESGVSKGSFASWILQSRNPVKLLARRIFPASWRKRLRSRLTDKPPEMSLETRKRLIAFYEPDIRELERLVGQSLAAWRA